MLYGDESERNKAEHIRHGKQNSVGEMPITEYLQADPMDEKPRK